MALAKIKPTTSKELIKRVIIGLLVISNIGLGTALITTSNELNNEIASYKESVKNAKEEIKALKSENKKLEKQASLIVNSESDIRIIREDLIEAVKRIVEERDREIQDVDILRAFKSTENRVMEEYIRTAALILATMETETNFKHIVSTNKNGTVDYGIMQVNEVVVPHLREALGDHLDPIHNRNHNVEGGSYEIYECYLKAKDKHPEDVIWWTYAYYNRGLYFEGTDAWKNPNNPNYKRVHKQANTRSNIFKDSYNAYYEALTASL